ncbi:PD-(D/E)XK nuclease family protein [Hymenobacter saemangeumensis]
MEENDTMLLNASVIDSIAAFYTEQKNKRYQALAELVPAILKNNIESKEQNRLHSRDLNVFRFFNPGETTHSRLLAYFLDPLQSHGQGDLFLIEFLRLLGIDQPETVPFHPWIVTAELGRVDVLIKRTEPHTVVVIENKSNYAEDQPNQLYRYWYQEIYLKQLERRAAWQETINPPRSRFRIIYLSPTSWKQADKQSVCKPEDWGADLPEAVPEGIIEHHLFSQLVTESLTKSLLSIPAVNHRLREFTQQYIQFWQSI